jgi:purine catabolism regulator
MLSLSKLLDPFGARLLAGAGGADRLVRWAHTSELVDPTPFLSGGELLLTNAIQLEDPTTQRAYLERLAEHGLAGLAIGTGVNIQVVPPAMLEVADTLGFPVYEIPYDVPFIAITERAFRAVAAEQTEILRRALRSQERLEQIVLREQGLPAIAQELAQLVEGTVVVFDGRAEPMCRADHLQPLAGEKLDALMQELQERRAAGHHQQFVPRHTGLDGPRPCTAGHARRAWQRRRPRTARVGGRHARFRPASRIRSPRTAPVGQHRRA